VASYLYETYLFLTKYGRKIKYIFWQALCLVEIFCHLISILAPNYKQHILSPAKDRKVCYSLAELCQIYLLEFILVEAGVKFMKRFWRRGSSYKSLGSLL
jgi:hypothetical protein